MSGTVAAGCESAPEPEVQVEKLSFEQDIVPVLEKQCYGCHRRNTYVVYPESNCEGVISFEDIPLGSIVYAGPQQGEPTGCPDLGLYERLTQLNAFGCHTLKYVVPGDAEQSFLIRKLKGLPCDTRPVDLPPSMITPDETALIEKWVVQGALP